MEIVKPIIKWVGGKTQIIDTIMENFPKEINNYHELFLGGGSVLLALLHNINNKNIVVKGTINAYDINETLVSMYKNIQSKPKDIFSAIMKILKVYNSIEGTTVNRKPKTLKEAKTSQESYYYWLRQCYNKLTQEEKNTPLGSAYFIFLNKTCFRGVYREGPNGFNVPFGHYKNPEVISEEHLMTMSTYIKNVKFSCMKFEDSFTHINESDYIYMDPPYAPENATSFVGYTKEKFSLEQHMLLFETCKKYKFMMSNANVPLVTDNFKDNKYKIKTITCKRSINSKNPNAMTKEVIITNY